jgi:hypothetical protein
MQGKRIRLLAMPEEPDPLPIGATGVVAVVHEFGGWQQIQVAWDAPNEHRVLALVVPPDEYELLNGQE